MLTQQQIQSARTTLGITPSSAPTVDRAAALQTAWGISPTSTPPDTKTLGAETAKQTLAGAEKMGSAITEGAQKFAAAPKVEKGMTLGQAAGAEAKRTGALLETGLGTAAGAVQSIFAPLTATMQKAADFTGVHPIQALESTQLGKSLNEWATAHPEAAKNLMDAITVGGGALADVGAGNPLKTDLGTAAQGVYGSSKEALSSVSDYLSKPQDVSTTPQAPITDKIRAYFAKDNVDPRLETTASRLENPVSAYKDYAKQAESAVKDVKADPPIATVGENIGNAYDNVVKMRRTVGKAMADELSSVKDTPVDISKPTQDFIDETAKGVGKMTSFDRKQVGTYLQEVKSLGDHPTAGALDDFLSRVPQELDVAKAAQNITDITNADRIIKGNLAKIRQSLTSTSGLEGYGAARNAYANLSDFLDQGAKYLGAKTQTGDFVRDVSVAKSAAESILNGGKKDWLMKLEGLTGYKALDDATLAIQAMKDAGDTRGLSLFKSLGEGALHPTSLPFKILQWGVGKVAKKALGSPAQQTQAFLESLKTGAAPK